MKRWLHGARKVSALDLLHSIYKVGSILDSNVVTHFILQGKKEATMLRKQ